MNYLKNFYGHLCTILHHKNLVRHYCFKAGLYKQGIMHDWSKYNPIEFFAGVKYYQGGKRSPNFAEKEDKKYSSARERIFILSCPLCKNQNKKQTPRRNCKRAAKRNCRLPIFDFRFPFSSRYVCRRIK